MTLQPVLIDGEWREAESPSGFFTAFDPKTGSPLDEHYPISSFADLERALAAGRRAAGILESAHPDAVAEFLEESARRIVARSTELAKSAARETALPIEPRLHSVEIPRTVDQLRQAAVACRDRSWRRATIDTRLNIRSRMAPLGGPVVIFGPSNFPFAFNSVAGGDFAAAIAAGNPVIAKANPVHPGTTRLLAETVMDAARSTGFPPAAVQLLYHFSGQDGARLVSHPLTGATAFTGSFRAGTYLKEAADRVGKPIYLEMSSVNPLFVLPGAIEERSGEVVDELFNSCALGAGQFCTKPGLVVVIGDERGRDFFESARTAFETPPTGWLLSEAVLKGLSRTVDKFREAGAELVCGGSPVEGPGWKFRNTLLRTDGKRFLESPSAFQIEVFGTLTVFVFADSENQMIEIAESAEGGLTAVLYSSREGRDDALYDRIAPILRRKVGRLLDDKMPTGVAVTPAMNHGGPFPSTGHPGFTAVGLPASMLRFASLHCYDNVRKHRLPDDLRDKNPTGSMWRLIDGVWTQADAYL